MSDIFENRDPSKQIAIVVGEEHANTPAEAEKLIAKYDVMFKMAAEQGIYDAMIEVPPKFQDDINGALEAYRSLSPDLLSGLLYGPDSLNNTTHAKIVLAAMYGFDLHTADSGNRADIDIYRFFKENLVGNPGLVKNYTDALERNSPSIEGFLKSLPEELKDVMNDMAGHSLTDREISQIIKDVTNEGIDNRLNRRVIEDDQTLADTMLKAAEGRSFISFFGIAHGSLIDEDNVHTSAVDLEGALRQKLGNENVFHFGTVDSGTYVNEKPQFLIKDDLSITSTDGVTDKPSDPRLIQPQVNLPNGPSSP